MKLIGAPRVRLVGRPQSPAIIPSYHRGLCPQASAAIKAMTTQPSMGERIWYDDLLGGLVEDGLWPLLDTLYLFCVADSQQSRVNLKNPGTNTCSITGSPTFTPYHHWQGGGVSDWLSTSFNPSSATGRVWAQDSAHMGGYIENNVAATAGPFGPNDSRVEFYPRTEFDVYYLTFNDASAVFALGSTDSRGHWICNRLSGPARTLRHDGDAVLSDAVASSAVPTASLLILRGVTVSTYQISAFHSGAGLTADQQTLLRARIAAFRTAAGL